MSLHVSAVYSLLLSRSPLYGCTPICVSIHLSIDIRVVSSWWLLKIELLCTFVYKPLHDK